MNSQQAKQRFGIIGNDKKLERAIDVALQVAPTDISILVIEGQTNIIKFAGAKSAMFIVNDNEIIKRFIADESENRETDAVSYTHLTLPTKA